MSQKQKIAQEKLSPKAPDQFQSTLQIWLLLKKVKLLGRRLSGRLRPQVPDPLGLTP